MPFIDQFREGVYNFADILTTEINEFKRLFDDLDAEYKKTFAKLQTMLAQSAQEKKSSAKESKKTLFSYRAESHYITGNESESASREGQCYQGLAEANF
nr:hypothetical protein [Tanacetum cinerariifolium]